MPGRPSVRPGAAAAPFHLFIAARLVRRPARTPPKDAFATRRRFHLSASHSPAIGARRLLTRPRPIPRQKLRRSPHRGLSAECILSVVGVIVKQSLYH